MATVAGIKIKTKAPRERRIAFADEKYTGTEPEWDTEAALAMDDATFDNRLRRCFYYYNYHYSQKDCKKHVVAWVQTQKEFSKEDVKAYIRSSDRSTSMTACSLIMAHKQGMPLKPRHVEFLMQTIREAIATADPEVVETAEGDTPKAYVPTIQDRLNEKTSELIGDLEGKYDDMESVKFYDWFTANSVVQSQLSKYEAVYKKRLAELEEASAKGADAQLKEGYSHYKATDFKQRIKWLNDLLSAVEQYRGVKKAAKKARVKKAPSKEKLVAKLKYCKTDTTLKVVSINPADIIGSSELWVYNNKTRKLGKYVAAPYHTLSVKGTSIAGYDEDKSVSKTLRKPDEQLKEFAKAGKVALRTFIKDIKAVEVKLNGRIGTDVLLLKTA